MSAQGDAGPLHESPLDHLTEDDVRAIATVNGFRNGLDYFRANRVASVTVQDGGSRLEARVNGHERLPYRQSISLTTERDGSVSVSGICTCPVGVNCKHVVAALLSAIGEDLVHESDAAAATPRGAVQAGAAASTVLTPAIAGWIDALARTGLAEGETYSSAQKQRLIYVIDLERDTSRVPRLLVTPTSARLLRDGTFADRASPLQLTSHVDPRYPGYVRAADRSILRELQTQPSPAAAHGIALADERGPAVLDAMIATGRARLLSVNGVAPRIGPPQPGRVHWRFGADGTQTPSIAIDGGAELCPVRMTPPHYVDASAGVIGPIETGLAARVAAGLLAAPPIPPNEAAVAQSALAERLPTLALPPLKAMTIEQIAGPPAPVLRLGARVAPAVPYYHRPYVDDADLDAVKHELAVARLSFRYGVAEISGGNRQHRPIVARNDQLYAVRRDPRRESEAFRRLAALGLAGLDQTYPWASPRPDASDLSFPGEADEPRWLDFLYRHVPLLRAEGWEIEITAAFPLKLVDADGPVTAELREGSGIDWFELDLGVTVDGERLDLVPALLPLLRRGGAIAATGAADPPIYVRLQDGRILAIPAARLAPILATLEELLTAGALDPQAACIGLSPLEAPAIADLEAAAAAAGATWRGGARIAEIGRLLRATGGIATASLPASFAGALRPYQARGVDWLQFLRTAQLGGVLADDMGLGKTVQALAYLAIEKAAGRMDLPALIVAPTSLVTNWQREAQRFVPDLGLLTLHGAQRKARFGDIPRHDVVLTTYPLLARDHAVLAAQSWHAIVLDEAQIIKNPDAIAARMARTLEARHRLALSGTPLENHLGELWSLFAFLSPGYLGDRKSFNRRWRGPIEKHGDDDMRRRLARRVRPFLLRRTKAEVAAELPSKTEIIEAVEMEPPQRDLYESIRLSMHAKIRDAIAARGWARSRIIVLDALLKLRQTCCDPRLLGLHTGAARKAGSAKLARLKEIVPQLVEEGRRILLFSQFTSMLALIEQELAVPHVLLTGDTRDRATPIQRFQAGEVPLFMISLRAGGLGLNLTAADTVIHYDPWWNPAVEDQATDRAHRIGQTKPVFVHKLVMVGSIEEKMDALKARKRELAAGLFDPAAGSTLELSEADINDLFGGA